MLKRPTYSGVGYFFRYGSDKQPQSKMASDEFFDEFIEIDYGSDSDVSFNIDSSDNENKGNTIGSTNKVKLKRNQLALISTAMANDDSLNRNELNEIWKGLTTKLNDIGPPTFTMLQWRRKWTQYKYNKKRRLNNVDINLPGDLSIDLKLQNQPLPFIEASVIPDGINVSSEVLENLNIVRQNQAVIKEKLDHSNSLLQQIFNKF